MEEETKDVATDTNVEVEETTNSNETVEETTESSNEEVEKLRKANSQILARAKKAEEENKKLKASSNNNNNQQLSEELKLIARGLSDEEIEQAKVIAKGKDISLAEAVKDPLFSIYQNDLEKQRKKENAKLGGSRGSGESTPEEPEFKSGMTREEHEKAWKKSIGK